MPAKKRLSDYEKVKFKPYIKKESIIVKLEDVLVDLKRLSEIFFKILPDMVQRMLEDVHLSSLLEIKEELLMKFRIPPSELVLFNVK